VNTIHYRQQIGYHPDPKDKIQWYYHKGDYPDRCDICTTETSIGFFCLEGRKWLCMDCGYRRILIVRCEDDYPDCE